MEKSLALTGLPPDFRYLGNLPNGPEQQSGVIKARFDLYSPRIGECCENILRKKDERKRAFCAPIRLLG